jgi:hypothetical protein
MQSQGDRRRAQLAERDGNNDQYSDEETERRATEALRRALTTPPKPQKEMVGRVGRPRKKRKRPTKSDSKDR